MHNWPDLKVVLAFCSVLIAATALLWNWRRTQKKLSYDYWSAPLMGSVKHNFAGRLEITLDGKVVKDVSQVSIRIQNSGSVPIEKKDFDTPVSISFNKKNAQLLSIGLVKAVPQALAETVSQNLAIKTSETQPKIELAPTLLNPKDEFTIAALVSGFMNINPTSIYPPSSVFDVDDSIEINGRIVGVKSFTRSTGGSDRPKSDFSSGLWFGFLAACFVVLLSGFVVVFSRVISEAIKQILK